MGNLREFKKFLDGRAEVLGRAEEALCAMQEKYEAFFHEVGSVREGELQQLREHVLTNRASLPNDFVKQLDEARERAERDYERKLSELKTTRDDLLREAEDIRRKSEVVEDGVRRENVELDTKEEALKAEVATILPRIEEYNRRIREMSSGFGFFKNLFAMRELQKERKVLDERQATLSAQIDSLRKDWESKEAGHVEREGRFRGRWVELKSEADAIETKIEHVTSMRSRLIERTMLEGALYPYRPETAPVTADDPNCLRCGQPNPVANHFCRLCAQRLKADRPDFAGSLYEIAELNLHHEIFSDGMKACQELIGLVRGLKSGLESFTKSVEEMIGTEKKYPLPKLDIEVPQWSVEYGRKFDRLVELGSQKDVFHPKELADSIEETTKKVYTEKQIKQFFETMGEELSRRAEAQW
jgi:predicted  nucleic acid-binding Zn-ribbon protein